MSDSSCHNVEWVIERFKPLLDKIDIDNVSAEPHFEKFFLADNPLYVKMGLEDCLLAVSRRKFKSPIDGFYTFRKKRVGDKDIFITTIFLNNTIYSNDNLELKIRRHRALVHELTHCIAAFLALGRIISENILDTLIRELGERAKINESEHYQAILSQIRTSGVSIAMALSIFPDEHFRLGYEDFDDSYTSLYKNLILDKEKFEKYFTPQMLSDFIRNIKANKIREALNIIEEASISVSFLEAISREFISMRLQEEFLEYYCRKTV
ncbi:hypothetical protein FACS1894190_12730 [Spirochaetia bacterium]|nr:hypothetical protein FACS1894190_12730 [Spirochaetia bacterium]